MRRLSIFYIWSLLLFVLIFLGLVAIASADQNSNDDAVKLAFANQIDLPSLIKFAYEHNPKIQAARTDWQATIEKLPQMTSLPDPMAMYGYFIRSVETRVGPQRQRFGISQSFPYPGTLDAAGEVILKQIEIQEKKYEQEVRDVIVGIKLSYYELAYLERAIQITQQNQELLDHIVKLASTQYAENKATFNDLLKAQSQQAQLSYDLVLLRELREVEQANIRSFLNLPQDTPLGAPVPVPYATLEISQEELSKIALQQRQELQIADLMVQKAEKSIKLAKMQNKPMFNLELMTIDTGDAIMLNTPDSGKNPWTITLGFSLPIWGQKKNGRVHEAQLNRQSASENKQSMEALVLANIRNIYFKLENSNRLVELYENTLIPQAEKAIEESETWNQEKDPKSIAGFLETQSVWLNFNLARARAIADYQQNLTRMEQLIGGSLDKGQEN